MVKNYIPSRGDIVWLNFTPQSGHEQAGKRPAIVLSPKSYNMKTGLAILCPITSKIKGYPFEVPVSSKKVSGVVLADQVKNLDWQARNIEFISAAPENVIDEISEKLGLLIL